MTKESFKELACMVGFFLVAYAGASVILFGLIWGIAKITTAILALSYGHIIVVCCLITSAVGIFYSNKISDFLSDYSLNKNKS